MKKCFLFALGCMLLSVSSFAQLQKGNLLMGGNLNFQIATTDGDVSNVIGDSKVKENSFSFGPVLGYFVSDRTVVGMKFSYITSNSESVPQTGLVSTIETSQIFMGPFLRRYFAVKEWLAFYGQAELNYGSANSSQKIDGNTSTVELKTRSVNFVTSLGLSFFPTKWMSIDLSANPFYSFHRNSRAKVEDQSIPDNSVSYELTTNGFNFNLNSNSFFIGAHFFLNRK